jgi:hypothetical protein
MQTHGAERQVSAYAATILTSFAFHNPVFAVTITIYRLFITIFRQTRELLA